MGLPKPRPTVARPQTTSTTAPSGRRPILGDREPSARAQRDVDADRGPARVMVEPSGPILVAEGKATATLKFAQPGTYVLRATANDGALSTKSDVTITVEKR
jgi:hypothetical protein